MICCQKHSRFSVGKAALKGRRVGLDKIPLHHSIKKQPRHYAHCFLCFAPGSTFRFSLMGKASLMGGGRD